jgi:hypothetical protein
LNYYKALERSSFIGRDAEIEHLRQLDASPTASLVVVYGRRRVGKTALIEQSYRERNLLKFEGLEGGDQERQIEQCLYQLARYAGDGAIERLRFTRWLEFFDYLWRFIEQGRCTLYLEELQWLASYREELIADLKHAWDNTFRRNPQLVVVLCGSAPSFMVGKVLRSAALYGRVAAEIHLRPFPLVSTAEFLGPNRSPFDALEAQLALGGIPEYLNFARAESSTYLALCRNAFLPSAYFLNECDRIFVSSLAKSVHYRRVIEHLAARRSATRQEIADRCRLKPGGTLSALLDDLALSGFIEGVIPYDRGPRSKLVRYQIADPYLQFYYRFVAPQRRAIDSGRFEDNPALALPLHDYQQWLGFAFERWCRTEHHRIARLLGFSGVRYRSGAWIERAGKPTPARGTPTYEAGGFQLDLVFDRADRVLTVCQIKHTAAPVGADAAREFVRRVEALKVPRRTTVQRILVSASGAEPEVERGGYFDRVLTLEELMGRS